MVSITRAGWNINETWGAWNVKNDNSIGLNTKMDVWAALERMHQLAGHIYFFVNAQVYQLF